MSFTIRRFLFPTAALYLLAHFAFTGASCKHDPLLDDINPGDTTPVDTTPVDTTITGTPCDPNAVYFNQQVLPLLLSNCAFSGCHDDASHEEGVILTSYQKVMQTAGVKPFDLDGGDLYEVLVEDDPDKRMPLDRPPLSQSQIQLIAAWISQGAQNLECDPDAGACDTESVSFAQDIKPVLESTCQGCHSGSAPSGGVSLSSYAGVKAVADDGRLRGVTAWLPGFPKMPQGGSQLPDCAVEKIKAWVDAGALNN